MTTKELKNENDARQTGVLNEDVPPIKVRRLNTAATSSDLDEAKAFGKLLEAKRLVTNPYRGIPGYEAESAAVAAEQEKYRDDISEYIDSTRHATDIGYGTARMDYDLGLMEDMTDARAIAQSNISKVGSGLLKAITTTGTQFLDGTAGNIAALLNVPIEGVKSIVTGSNFDSGNAMSSNIVTRTLQDKVTPFFEDIFPNYRTYEEQSPEWQREWWKHINANFIGDDLLKNIGFTIGSIGAAYVNASGWNKVAMRKLSNDLFKGTVAAAEGDTAARQAIEAFRGGKIDVHELAKNSSYAAKRIRKMQLQQQVLGAVGGAASEARVEAINNAREFLEEQNEYLTGEYNAGLQTIEQDMYNESQAADTGWFEEVPLYDSYGNEVSSAPALTEAGEAEKARRQQALADQFARNREFAAQQAEHVANATFWLNIPILTASNAIQFGRMFAGGFKSMRKMLSPVKGGLEFDTKAGKVVGNFAKKGTKAGALVRAAMNPLSEGNEELLQKVVSEGSKSTGAANVASFNHDAYDEYGMRSMWDWISNVSDSFVPTVADGSTWKEFAVGALTGLIPFGPGAGITGAYREEMSKQNNSEKLAQKLNDIVNSEEFQNRWKWGTRAFKYEKNYKDAVENGNRYIAKSAESKAITNDIIAFAKAGRLDDLEATVDFFANVSESDKETLEEIRSMTESTTGEQSIFSNTNDAEMVKAIHARAKELKRHIVDVREASDAIRTRGPIHIDEDKLQEMTFTEAQMRDAEYRYSQLYDDAMDGEKDSNGNRTGGLRAVLTEMSKRDSSGKFQKLAERAKTLLEKEEALKNLFSAGIRDVWNIVSISQDKRKEANELLGELKEMAEKSGDASSLLKIVDMQKLIQDRSDYLTKLYTLSDMEDDTWQEKKQTKDKKAAEQEAQMQAEQNKADQKEIDELTKYGNVDELRDALRRRTGRERRAFREQIRAAAKRGNEVAKMYIELVDKGERLRSAAEKITKTSTGTVVDKLTKQDLSFVINALLRKARGWNAFKASVAQFSKSEFERIVSETNATISQLGEKVKETGIEADNRTVDVRYNAMRPVLDDLVNNMVEDDEARPDSDVVDEHAKSTPIPPTRDPGPNSSNPGSQQPLPPPFKVDKAEANKEKENVGKSGTENANASEVSVPVVAASKQELLMQKEQEKAKEAQGDREEARLLSLADASDAVQPGADDASDARPYYFPAVPEFDVEKKRQGDYTPFGTVHPEFGIIYDGLSSEGAFEYVDKGGLSVGSEIEFGIDPSILDNDGAGNLPILMFHVDKKGVRHVVGVLRKNGTEKFVGLTALSKRIRSEYADFEKNHPGERYVFGKKSKVWMVKTGQLEYLAPSDTGANDRSLGGVHMGYDGNAPFVLLVGSKSYQIGTGLTSSELSTYATRGRGERSSALFYVCRDAAGNQVPIRVNVAHYNAEEADDNDASIVNVIHRLVRDIANPKNWSDETLFSKKKALENVLYSTDVHFYAATSSTGERWLSIRKDKLDDEGNPVYEETEQIRDDGSIIKNRTRVQETLLVVSENDDNLQEKVQDIFYGMNRPIQVTSNTSHSTLVDMALNGLLTTNATSAYPRGANFYVDPYNEKTGDFSDTRRSIGDSVKPAEAQQTKESVGKYVYGHGVSMLDTEGQLHMFEDVEHALGSNSAQARSESDILSTLTKKSAISSKEYRNYVGYLSSYYGVDLSDIGLEPSPENRQAIARRIASMRRTAIEQQIDAVSVYAIQACASADDLKAMESSGVGSDYRNEHLGANTSEMRKAIERSVRMTTGAKEVQFVSAGQVLKSDSKSGIVPIVADIVMEDGTRKRVLAMPVPHNLNRASSASSTRTVTGWLRSNPVGKNKEKYYKQSFQAWYSQYATALDNLRAINGLGFADQMLLIPIEYEVLENGDLQIPDVEDAVVIRRVPQAVVPLSASQMSDLAVNGQEEVEQETTSNENESAADDYDDTDDESTDSGVKFMEVGDDLRGYERGINLEEELKWLDSVLPQLGRDKRVRIVRGLIRTAENGAGAYGKLQDGLVYISDEGVEGTTYHEAFHFVMDNMLSPSERLALLKEASRIYKTKDISVLSEEMADDFREWMLTGTVRRNSSLARRESEGLWNKIKDFFEYLRDIISNLTSLQPHMHRLFNSIYRGEFAVGKPVENGTLYDAEVEQGKYSDEMMEAIAAMEDSHFPEAMPENSIQVWDVGVSFKQEHIDSAVDALKRAVAKGFTFDFGGKTHNITYDSATGFKFYNLSKSRELYGKKSNNSPGAVKRFLEIIGSTGMNFKYLDSEVQGYLQEDGWTETEYDALSNELKKQALMCAGVL